MRAFAIVAWVGGALAATVALGVAAVEAGPIPEWGHLVGHVILCGGLAALLAAGDASTRGSARAWSAGLLFGVAIEVVQLWSVRLSTDTLFDLAMDAFGAALGLVAVGSVGRERAEPVGHALSATLHPLLVAPFGVAAVVYAAERALLPTLLWTAVAALCVLPAVGWWAAGVLGGWWTDADVSPRAERGPLFVAGCAGALAFAALAHAAPPPVSGLAAGVAVGAVAGASLTRAGLKVSGHVAIPAALGLLLLPWSVRGPIPVLGIALVLSWARVAAGRHRPLEVAAAWGVAGLACLPLAA